MFSTRHANVLRVLRHIGNPTRAYATRGAGVVRSGLICSHVERTPPLQSRLTQRAGNFSVWCARPIRDASPLAVEEEPWNCYHDEVMEHLKSRDAIIIDVRGVDEIQETGLMEGVHNIPLPELKEALELPGDKFKEVYGLPKPDVDDARIIFFCKSSKRSFKAVKLAQELGYTKARHYPGGWKQWEELENKQP